MNFSDWARMEDRIYTRHIIIHKGLNKTKIADKQYSLKSLNIESVVPGDIISFPHSLIHKVLGAAKTETRKNF